MKLYQLLAGVKTNLTQIPEGEISNIENDSRKCDGKCLFIASSGYIDDAHPFIPDAYQRGCRYFVIDAERLGEFELQFPGAVFLPVSNLKRALALIARNFFNDPSSKLTVIGITGTNGKTTTAFAIYSMLRKMGKLAGLIGTIEYRINDLVLPAFNTTPDILTLNRLLAQMVQEGIEYVPMEISSHSLALGRVDGLQLNVAAFTNFTRDHLDFHGTIEEYFQAKLKIFKLLSDSGKSPKFAFINKDLSVYQKINDYIIPYTLLENGIKVRTISLNNPDADYYAQLLQLTPRNTKFLFNGKPVEIGMIGDINIYNFTLAGAILTELGFDWEKWSSTMRDIKVRGRMEAVDTGRDYDVFVDYAHTPDALENSLKVLRKVKKKEGRLICIFGAGGDRDRSKRPLMGEAAARLADLVIVTSDNPRTEDPLRIIKDVVEGVKRVRSDFNLEPDRHKAIQMALDIAQPNDLILIAGKGHEDYQIVGKTKHHFSDQEEVRNYFAKKLHNYNVSS